MPNIFDGLNKLQDSIIRDNIAMLEAVTMGNVVKGYGTTVANKGAKLINGVGSFLGKNPNVSVKEEKRLEGYIKDKKYEIRNLHRYELDLRLKNQLRGKLEDSISSDDSISVSVINSVAKHMKLAEHLTTAQKADGIHRRYLEKALNLMQENLKKQSSTESKRTMEEIDKNIANFNEIDKEKLKELLNIDELTGKEITNVLKRAGAPALIMGTLSASGFGAFMALTTVMHAVFTTIIGVTLPFAVYTGATSTLSFMLGPAGIALLAGTTIWQVTKGNKNLKNEIMGQIVFSAVNANGGSFVAKYEDLPSYESNKEELERIAQRDKEYSKLVEFNKRLQEDVNRLEYKSKESQKSIIELQNKVKYEKDKRQYSEKLIIKLNSEKEYIIKSLRNSEVEITRLEEEISLNDSEELRLELDRMKKIQASNNEEINKLNENIKYQSEIIEEASNEIKEKDKYIEEENRKSNKLEEENQNLKDELELNNQEKNKIEKIRKAKLEKKWINHYSDFGFKKSAIRDAVKFSKEEIEEIERALIELHSATDYKSVSRGKIRGTSKGIEYEHMGLSLPCGFPTRILYTITKNSDKKVIIESIYKHNENKFK